MSNAPATENAAFEMLILREYNGSSLSFEVIASLKFVVVIVYVSVCMLCECRCLLRLEEGIGSS